MLPPEIEGLTLKEWAALVTATVTAGLLGLKQFLRMRSDWRVDHAEGSAENVAARTIATLTKQADRQEQVIGNLSDQLARIDERLQATITARYEAEAEAAVYRKRLDAAAEMLEQANRRCAATDESTKIFKSQCTALEMEVRRLSLQLREAGIEPPGDGEPI